jgi:cystathionine beta-lyase/cystathionine gamma-synthase
MTPTAPRPSHNGAHIETKLIHAGEPEPRFAGAVSMPIFQSSIFETEGGGDYNNIPYIRLNNTPNHRALAEKLAALENAEAALVAGSGMAAISAALLSVLKSGDHLLIQSRLYGGTHTFATHVLPRFNIDVDFVDSTDPTAWEAKRRETTRVFYVETLSNPLVDVPELEQVLAFARKHGLVSMIDNTVASPVNFRAAEFGFDLSLHSATKYMNGHSDIVAGAVIGRRELVEETRHVLNHLGGSLDPHACHLLHRGLKTLAVRMPQHNRSALALAEYLEGHPAVARVYYPGLASHASHARAHKWLEGCSGLLSFEVDGDADDAVRVMRTLRIPIRTGSLGGVETLISRPAVMSHSGMSAEERAAAGVSDGLIRVSVGLESVQDLIDDFGQALDGLGGTSGQQPAASGQRTTTSARR